MRYKNEIPHAATETEGPREDRESRQSKRTYGDFRWPYSSRQPLFKIKHYSARLHANDGNGDIPFREPLLDFSPSFPTTGFLIVFAFDLVFSAVLDVGAFLTLVAAALAAGYDIDKCRHSKETIQILTAFFSAFALLVFLVFAAGLVVAAFFFSFSVVLGAATALVALAGALPLSATFGFSTGFLTTGAFYKQSVKLGGSVTANVGPYLIVSRRYLARKFHLARRTLGKCEDLLFLAVKDSTVEQRSVRGIAFQSVFLQDILN